jgi:hypothetical protein
MLLQCVDYVMYHTFFKVLSSFFKFNLYKRRSTQFVKDLFFEKKKKKTLIKMLEFQAVWI